MILSKPQLRSAHRGTTWGTTQLPISHRNRVATHEIRTQQAWICATGHQKIQNLSIHSIHYQLYVTQEFRTSPIHSNDFKDIAMIFNDKSKCIEAFQLNALEMLVSCLISVDLAFNKPHLRLGQFRFGSPADFESSMYHDVSVIRMPLPTASWITPWFWYQKKYKDLVIYSSIRKWWLPTLHLLPESWFDGDDFTILMSCIWEHLVLCEFFESMAVKPVFRLDPAILLAQWVYEGKGVATLRRH